MSRIILESGLCTLPANNALWDTIQLAPRELDDRKTCFHGTEFGNCDTNTPWQKYRCKWWRFLPSDRKPELYKKFRDIYTNKPPPTKADVYFYCFQCRHSKIYGLDLFNKLIGMFKTTCFNYMLDVYLKEIFLSFEPIQNYPKVFDIHLTQIPIF